MPTIADVISSRPNELSLLLEAIKAAGYDKKLEGPEKFTLFAPTNDAIKQELTTLNLTQEEYFGDKQRLEGIVKFLLVPDEVIYSKDVKEDKTVKTLQGNTVDLSNENDNFCVNGITITMRDQVADNGVVHIMDRVLMPPVPYDPEHSGK